MYGSCIAPYACIVFCLQPYNTNVLLTAVRYTHACTQCGQCPDVFSEGECSEPSIRQEPECADSCWEALHPWTNEEEGGGGGERRGRRRADYHCFKT